VGVSNVARLKPIQVVSLRGRADTFPRGKWVALCETLKLRRPRQPDTWFRFDGSSFIIRASDVVAEDRGAVPPAWGVRLEAAGKLDAAGLKLWVELGLAAQALMHNAGFKEIETSVFSPG
jgi:hypothetical protein